MTIHRHNRMGTRVQSGNRFLNAPTLLHARHIAWPAFLILAFLIPNVLASAAEPTYYGQIVRMMQNKCIQCHHTGGVAISANTTTTIATKQPRKTPRTASRARSDKLWRRAIDPPEYLR